MAISDPRDISGLLAWYSPEHEAANYSDGDQLTTVTDLSGNGNHATAFTTSTTKPLYKSTGGPSGGAQRFRFDNGGYIKLPSGIMTGATAGEIMAMFKNDYNGATDSGWWKFGSSANSNHMTYSSQIFDDFGCSVRRSCSTIIMSVNVWRRVSTWSAASDWAMYLDGSLQYAVSNADPVGWITVPTIGNSGSAGATNTSTDTFEGDFGAIVLYNRKLTSGERSDLVTWMNAHPSGGEQAASVVTVSPDAATASAQGQVPTLSGDGAASAPAATATAQGLAPTVGDTQTVFVDDVLVEIAFDSGYSTPAVDRTWTDVTDYVELHEGVEITYGRQDEFATCDPNTLRLTLDNTDGRFTARRAASPYYPNVKVGRPIRVKATRPGGTASVRFVGYIDEWPIEWDGTDAYAKTQISATSRTARLGQDSQLRSIVEVEILTDSPVAYYTMGEAEGAVSAADSSGLAAPSLVMAGTGTDVVFGSATGPPTDGLTAVDFSSVGKYLHAENAAPPGSPDDWSVVGWFNTTNFNGILVRLGSTLFHIDVFGGAVVAGDSISEINSGGSYNDGATHMFAFTQDTSGFASTLYVDGVNVGSSGTVYGYSPTISVGGTVASTFSGSMAHVAVFHSVLTPARILAMYQAGHDGFAGETPGERIERYASYGAVPLAEIAADTGSAPMAHIDTTGQTSMDMLRVVETTEGGVLFDGRENDLTFHDRTSRYLATSSFTLSVESQHVENGIVPKVDRTGLQNDVTATLNDGTVTANIVDQASVDDYGRKTAEFELATTDVNAPAARAAWQVATYGEPRTRIPALSVDITPLTSTLQDAILAADIGTLFTLDDMPGQAEDTTVDFFVEGYTETIGLASHVFTFNVSDASAFAETFVLDSATRGVLDTNVLAY